MNILLRLLFLVTINKVVFISFAHAYTVTSSSSEESVTFNTYVIKYSRENITLPPSTQNRPHIGEFLTKGAYMSIKNIGDEERILNFTIKGIKRRNRNIYMLMPGGDIIEGRSSNSYTILFNNQRKKTNTVYFLLESRSETDVRIIIRENGRRKKIHLNFKSNHPSNYCKLNVIDAKGGISFKNEPSPNNAGFTYDTDQEKSLSFQYKIDIKSGSLKNEAKTMLNKSFHSILIDDIPYEPGDDIIFRKINGLINRANEAAKEEHHKINGMGLIKLNPLINMRKNRLPAGTYNIRTIVTCN